MHNFSVILSTFDQYIRIESDKLEKNNMNLKIRFHSNKIIKFDLLNGHDLIGKAIFVYIKNKNAFKKVQGMVSPILDEKAKKFYNLKENSDKSMCAILNSSFSTEQFINIQNIMQLHFTKNII